jgi:hypothetical protein
MIYPETRNLLFYYDSDPPAPLNGGYDKWLRLKSTLFRSGYDFIYIF